MLDKSDSAVVSVPLLNHWWFHDLSQKRVEQECTKCVALLGSSSEGGIGCF